MFLHDFAANLESIWVNSDALSALDIDIRRRCVEKGRILPKKSGSSGGFQLTKRFHRPVFHHHSSVNTSGEDLIWGDCS